MKFLTSIIAILILSNLSINAQTTQEQSEEDKIIAVLNNYIVGTAYNYPDQVKSAFMPEANMFLDHKDKPLYIMKIEEYASHVGKSEAGKFNGRQTNILSIERYEGIAMAKLEVVAYGKRFMDFLLLKKLENGWKIISKTAASRPSKRTGNKALLIVSNVSRQGDSDLSAGNSFSEIVIAYSGYQKAGYHVDIISPNGGEIPLAYINPSDSLQLQYLYNSDFMYAIKNTKRPSDIEPDDYSIVQFTGGSSPIFDVPQNEKIQAIVMHIYEINNGVIAAVCHGTAGLVNLKTSEGIFLVEGKNINGVPDSHESKSLPHYQHYPFIIQTTLQERGGHFKHSDIRQPHMEVDGRLVTGQNSLSSEMVTNKSIEVSQELINGN